MVFLTAKNCGKYGLKEEHCPLVCHHEEFERFEADDGMQGMQGIFER
jgi:hypothetical protein